MTGKPFHICEGVLGARPSWPFIMKTESNLPPFLPSRKSGCQIASGKVEQISRIKAMAEISDTSVKWVDHETAVKPPEPPGKSQLWCQSKHDAADRRGNTFPILSLKWMLPRLCSWRQNGESKYCDLLFVFNAQMGGFFFLALLVFGQTVELKTSRREVEHPWQAFLRSIWNGFEK